jgi:predicted Zn-dependent protease
VIDREWMGFLYDGRTADKQPVALTLEVHGVRIRTPDGMTTHWPIADVRQTQGSFSSEQMRIEFGTDPVQALIVDEPGFVEAMRQSYPLAPLRGQAQTTRFALWSVGALVAAIVLYVVGAPVAASWTAERVPVSWEAALGREVTREMAPESKQCVDPMALGAAREILNRLIATTPENPYQFSLAIVKDSMINAFAAPGGFVVVNSGLLKAAETPEQFAGVLAHELQHVLLRHTTRGILRDAPIKIAIQTLFGGTSAETVGQLVGTMGVLSYRRGDESEADREGLRMLQAAGIDPTGMVEFMKVLDQQNKMASSIPKYLSSHPRSADRAEVLNTLAKVGSVAPGAPLDRAEWSRVRNRCN